MQLKKKNHHQDQKPTTPLPPADLHKFQCNGWFCERNIKLCKYIFRCLSYLLFFFLRCCYSVQIIWNRMYEHKDLCVECISCAMMNGYRSTHEKKLQFSPLKVILTKTVALTKECNKKKKISRKFHTRNDNLSTVFMWRLLQ